jgi:hypothetical protein
MPRDEAPSQPDACSAPPSISPRRAVFFMVVFLVMMGSGGSIFFLAGRPYGIQLAASLLHSWNHSLRIQREPRNAPLPLRLSFCSPPTSSSGASTRWLSRCPFCHPDGSPTSSHGSVPFLVRPHRPQRQFALRNCPGNPLFRLSSRRDRQYPLYPRPRAPSSSTPTDPRTGLARVILFEIPCLDPEVIAPSRWGGDSIGQRCTS